MDKCRQKVLSLHYYKPIKHIHQYEGFHQKRTRNYRRHSCICNHSRNIRRDEHCRNGGLGPGYTNRGRRFCTRIRPIWNHRGAGTG